MHNKDDGHSCLECDKWQPCLIEDGYCERGDVCGSCQEEAKTQELSDSEAWAKFEYRLEIE